MTRHRLLLALPLAFALHADAVAAGIPATGTPRLTPIDEKPWGMREFAIVDPNGNLVRVGQPAAGG